MFIDLLSDSGPDWTRAPPASAQVLDELRITFPSLPAVYYSLLAQTNGGEGELAVEPGWFQLWPAEAVAERNTGYEVAGALPGCVAIGSNGGGELFALDPAGRVLVVPFIPMDLSEAVCIADDVPGFARQFGHRLDAA